MSSIDVIVPCYNYAHFLGPCVESVLAQEGVQVRVMILDDASSDNTAAVSAALAERDTRVVLRRHEVNKGHIATYNEGLAWASGDYTLLLDADDALIPGALYRAAYIMDGNPAIGMCYGQVVYMSNEKPAVKAARAKFRYRIASGADWIKTCCAIGTNIVPTPTAVVRTSLLKSLGGYRSELPHSGDLEMWIRFALYGSIGIVEEYQGYKRVHKANMSLQYYRGLGDLQQRKAAFDMIVDEHSDRIENPERLRAMVMDRLAEGALRSSLRAFSSRDTVLARAFINYARGIVPAAQHSLTRTWIWSVLRLPIIWRLQRFRLPGGFYRRILHSNW